MSTATVELDVRPTLRAGGEPFEQIMQAVALLKPHEGLRLLATFKPVPLFSVLASRGFTHEEKELEGGDWEILFTPSGIPEKGNAVDAGAAETSAIWPEPAEQLDNRDLEPPEPMVRILAAIEAMEQGQVLAALLHREPIFLLPELAKRGHQWRGGFEDDGATYRILIRVGARTEKPA
jgi:TusA-related sulfurtransferase